MKRFEVLFLLTISLFSIQVFAQSNCGMTLNNYSYSLNDAAFLNDSTVIVVGDYGVIMKSNDLGTTWRRINGGPAYSFLKTQFLNSQTGYILGSYNLLRTDDGGETWFKIPLNNIYASNLYFLSPDTGFVVGGGGKIFKTVDGGRKWDEQQKGFEDLSSVTFVNDTIGFVCGASNTLFKTIDFGKTWQTINMSSFGVNLNFIDVVFTSDHDGYLLDSGGQIIATSDTGITWNTLNTLSPCYATNIYFVDGNIGYVIGGWSGSDFYKTTNGGTTWNRVNFSSLGSISGIAFNEGGQKGIIVGDAAGYGSTSESGHFIAKSEDAGDNWTTMDYLDGADYFYDVSFIEDSIGYLFGGKYLGYGLGYKTTNAGLTWQKLPLFSVTNIRECQFINKDVGYIVSDSIYFTADSGNSWITVPNVAGPNMIGDKMFFFNADTGIYATQGTPSYLVRTTDRGINWDTVYMNNDWFTDIEFKGSLGFAVGYNTVLRSTDGGNTWVIVNTFSTLFMKTVFLLNADTIFIGGADGLLYCSYDSGLSWNNVNTGISSALDIVDLYFYHDSVGIAITNNNGGIGEIFLSYDYGLTWTLTRQLWENIYKYSDISNGKGFLVGDRGTLMKFDLINAPIFPSYIVGDTMVAKDSIYTYKLQSYDGETVNWTAVNGNILNTSLDSINISWPDTGNYTITVNLSNNCGLSPTRQFKVHVVDSVVGIIYPMSAQDGIKIFPNPTSGIINLSIDRKEHGNGCGSLFNSLGLNINNFIFNNGLSQLNISELNSGLYFLVVDFNQKRYITKIIKE